MDWDNDYYHDGFSSYNSRLDRAPSYSPISDLDSEAETRFIVRTGFRPNRKRSGRTKSVGIAPPVHSLPTEIIQDIAVRLDSDLDLSSLAKTSPTLFSILHPNGTNCVWRQRFLALYDYPQLESILEFPFAYKVRQLVLRHFDALSIGTGMKQKSGHQLDTIRDMIVETYNSPEPDGCASVHSKNLAILSSPNPPVWLVRLMSCSLYGSEKRKYGQPNFLFDMLQVSLSHLVLSPKSPIVAKIPCSRDGYDLSRVYNFNTPFATLLEVVEDEAEEEPPRFASSRFPNLRSPSITPEPEEPRYRLNMHVLLHIRNFWQRHFADGVHGVGENTYSSMIKTLSASDILPKEWEQPLSNLIPFNTNWYGHYSCLHPWPKDRQDIEERQSCAEDWEVVDPMTLDFETSTADDHQVFWPPLFSSIPVFANLIPDPPFSKDHNLTYLRGIAPFKDFKSSFPVSTDSTFRFPKWHPYLALRVNGFVHNIPDETLTDEEAQERRADAYDDDYDEGADRPIPGWKHIVMVMWKPSTQYLITVLEHAEEEYGGSSGAPINTADIWNSIDNTASSASTNTDLSQAPTSTTPNIGATQTTPSTQLTEAEIEGQQQIRLKKRIVSFAKNYTDLLKVTDDSSLPDLFSATHIRNLEDSFSPQTYLDWDDGTIEYAYAYEGIIIPGGKIMMGRWWRINGVEGSGAGKEVDVDGVGIEVRVVVRGENEEVGDEIGAESGSGSGSADASGGIKGKVKKNKARRKSLRGRKRKGNGRGKKRKARAMDEDTSDDEDESDFVDSEVEAVEEVVQEYEFVTVVDGEESRAVNGCKGLERGPFVFWAI